MGLDDIEWYETPTSDEELLARANWLTLASQASPVKSKDTGAQWIRSSSQWGWFKWSMWWIAMMLSSVWALFFGLIGVLLCCTVIGIPFGAYLMIVAGLPGASLFAMAKNTKEVKK